MRCPYPSCEINQLDTTQSECGCSIRAPLRKCERCQTLCRDNASFCRACGASLSTNHQSAAYRSAARGPDFLFLPGSFYNPPIAREGFLWALSGDGNLYRLSPRAAAAPIVWATVPSRTAGLNRFTVLDVRSPQGGCNGTTLLAADAEAIYAVSLVNRSVQELVRLTPPQRILAYTAVEQSSDFYGLAAGDDYYVAVAVTGQTESMRLMIRSFARDSAATDALTLPMQAVAGPVLNRTGVALCTRDAVYLYDTREHQTTSAPLPDGFEPYFRRPSRHVTVPPGHVPMTIQKTDAGWNAWISGEHHGVPGVLQLGMDSAHYSFHELHSGSCICALSTGGLAINYGDGAEIIGAAPVSGRISNPQPGMPIFVDDSACVYFRATRTPDTHQLTLMIEGQAPLALTFTDPDCNENTCCGMCWMDGNLFIAYICQPRNGQPGGLRLAHWTIQ